jgi:hypothetical protein
MRVINLSCEDPQRSPLMKMSFLWLLLCAKVFNGTGKLLCTFGHRCVKFYRFATLVMFPKPISLFRPNLEVG